MIWDLCNCFFLNLCLLKKTFIQFHQQLFRQQQQKKPRWTEHGYAISRPKRGLHMISLQNAMRNKRASLVWHFTLAYMDGRTVSSKRKNKPFHWMKKQIWNEINVGQMWSKYEICHICSHLCKTQIRHLSLRQIG